MEFIKTAYCVTIPFLFLLLLFGNLQWKKYSSNVLAISNILLIGHSVFFARQLLSGYQLMKSFSIDYHRFFTGEHALIVRVMLVVIMPLFSLYSLFRKNKWFSLLLLLLLYSVFPYSSWNSYDLLFKIPAYLCLLCSAYALLWLLNKLPYQSPVV